MKVTFPAALALLLAAITPARAQLSELRFGILAHDIGVLGSSKEDGADAAAEILFEPPGFLAPLWSPRPHVGVEINSGGDTSQLYAGLTWRLEPLSRMFVEFSLGGTVHNGKTESAGLDRKELGSRALFRESLSLGIQLDERNSISLIFDHVSNARLASHNEGLNNLGLRWGYRF